MPQSYTEINGVIGQCPLCNHPPIRHEPDGTGATCIVCLWLANQDIQNHKSTPRKICTLKFEFKLSRAEREQAVKADKNAYPQHQECAKCYCEWMAHIGYLCPSGDSTFVPLFDSKKPFLVTK